MTNPIPMKPEASRHPERLALRVFFATRREALCSAAMLLGGGDWQRRAARICDTAGDRAPLPRRFQHDVAELLGLVTLQHVDDADRIEAACFAAIDPADPVVEEIRLLSDRLQDVLFAVECERSSRSGRKVA